MRNVWLDMETYYDNEYSLRKMTPIEYVLDPRFETIGCSFWFEKEIEPVWVDGPILGQFLADISWHDTRMISHNAMFDMLVLALRYNIYPAAYGCTLSMARNWIRHQIGRVDLASCAKRYGMEKGTAVHNMKGVSYEAMAADPQRYQEYIDYCLQDTNICRQLWLNFLDEGFPVSELEVIDWTIRMVVQPQLEIDMIRVAEHLAAVKAEKQKLLDAAGLEDRSSLMSDELLAGVLMELGVEPPYKISPTTNEPIWAFAKSDQEFTDLLDHEDPKVQAVVAARLGHRSTIEETRAERFMAISYLTEAMPIPLRYSGAHTHRFSGDWSLNMQNLPNGSKLRQAIRAPKGHVVVSVDASQIEARFNATLSGEVWLVETFREGRDAYGEFATDIYGYEIDKYKHKTERTVGKIGILSLGYGSSWPVFQNMCRNKGGIILADDEAARIVNLYRNKNASIVDHWNEAKEVILMISHGEDFMWGALQIEQDALILPNGNKLRYHNLRSERWKGQKQWVYNQGPQIKRIYGAKVVENECQSLAFLHIAEVAMRVKKLTDGELWPCHQIHDELLYCVPEKLGEQVKRLVVQEMSKSPVWLPDAPLAAEGKIGETYGG